jgi:hypothetical protein
LPNSLQQEKYHRQGEYRTKYRTECRSSDDPEGGIRPNRVTS